MGILEAICLSIIIVMEVLGRVFVVLLVFSYVCLACSQTRSSVYCNEPCICLSNGKAYDHASLVRKWRKKVFSKRVRKLACGCGRPLFFSCLNFDFSLLLMLAGDIESNPGPTSSQSVGSVGSVGSGKVESALERLEVGQTSILDALKLIVNRLDKFEEELVQVKRDVDEITDKQAEMGKSVAVAREEAFSNECRIKDMEFVLDRQEQYSRKSSVRVLNIEEETAENVEEKFISVVKEQIGVDIAKNEIDIIHRVGRAQNGKQNTPRHILVKFMSHKTKETIMRRKREAKDIRIFEDLAYGIKKMFDFLKSQRSRLNLENVWTIDGKIKYKFIDNPRPFEIRNYLDYHKLINDTR